MHSNLQSLRDEYRGELLKNVIPFWMRHAIDSDGAINTCIQDDGTVVNRDRWGWSQWRALWVFSKLCNAIGGSSEWRDVAQGIYRYLRAHGPLDNGHWPLLFDGAGAVKRGYESIYTDAFAIYGLVEYWRATGDEDALSAAAETFDCVQHALKTGITPPAWPYPIPAGCIAHGLSMILSLAYFELGQATGGERYMAKALKHHERVMNQFLRADSGFVLEWLHHDGSKSLEPHGSAVCPGHAIESMWFQIHIARGQASLDAVNRAISAIHFHLNHGWDAQCGGLFLAIDSEGRTNVDWPHADKKLWWPHTEALYATLLAYEMCQETWCLEWHSRIRDYSFEHFRQPQYGEWTQKLDRRGNVIREPLFLPVKDPFHLPRALIYCIEVLDRLVGDQPNLERRGIATT